MAFLRDQNQIDALLAVVGLKLGAAQDLDVFRAGWDRDGFERGGFDSQKADRLALARSGASNGTTISST